VGKPQILRFLNMTVQTIGVTLHLLLGCRYCDIIFTIIYIYIVLLKFWKMQLNWHVFKINCCVIIFFVCVFKLCWDSLPTSKGRGRNVAPGQPIFYFINNGVWVHASPVALVRETRTLPLSQKFPSIFLVLFLNFKGSIL
jgi:hypothetical protein